MSVDLEISRANQELLQWVNALSSPKRLMCLILIRDKKKETVTGLAKTMDISQPLIYQHLKIMKDSGLLETTQKGRKIFYSLKKSSCMRFEVYLRMLLKTQEL